MDENNVDYSAAIEAMDRSDVTPETLFLGINHCSGRLDDPYVDDAFILVSVVDDGKPIEIHCIATKLEERYAVLHVSRVRE